MAATRRHCPLCRACGGVAPPRCPAWHQVHQFVCLLDDRGRLAEPRPLTPAEIAGHGSLLREDPPGPFARFGVALLTDEEGGVVVVGLGQRGNRRGLLERLVCAVLLAAIFAGVLFFWRSRVGLDVRPEDTRDQHII